MATDKTLAHLSIADYDVYGFDIDHTLAKYNIPNLFNLVYDALATYLVNEKGYDQSLKQQPFDKDFCTRGLVYDIKKGNFLKLGEDGSILRCSHGTQFLSTDQVAAVYGESLHWPHFEQLINQVNNIGDDFRIFENFFDMPAIVIVARLVDIKDKEAQEDEKSYDFWSDVYDAFNHVYDPRQYANDAGGFFDEWKQNVSRYVEPCSAMVKEWLQRLKSHSKKMVVITSSYHDFAIHSLTHVLGPDWRSYFDLFLTYARKPGFFVNKKQFLRTEGSSVKEPVTELKEGGVYSQGNCARLTQYLCQLTGKDHPKVLFIGDSIRSDIYPSKRFAGWDTLLILEEMEAEQHLLPSPQEQGHQPQRKRRRTMEPLELEKEYLTSRLWGSLFTDENKQQQTSDSHKYMNTLWGFIIRKYADVAVPQLDYISDLPLDYKFTCFKHESCREWGFYPKVPAVLQDEVKTS